MKAEYDRGDVELDLEAADLLDRAYREISEATGVHWKRIVGLAFLIRKRAEVLQIVLPDPSAGRTP